jgi:hypothetical protein
LIAAADEFVLYDSAQYTTGDWRNRNRIKTRDGLRWLTIPIRPAGNPRPPINQAQTHDPEWADRHWRTIAHAYARAPAFAHFAPRLSALYREAAGMRHISRINHLFLVNICQWLGITTSVRYDTDYQLAGGKSERLLNLCLQAKATTYLSGPAARDYLDTAIFAERGIAVQWADYSGYREYPQCHGPFEHAVSIIDLLLNTGPDARDYLKLNMGDHG